jgi:hypothetical protein
MVFIYKRGIFSWPLKKRLTCKNHHVVRISGSGQGKELVIHMDIFFASHASNELEVTG